MTIRVAPVAKPARIGLALDSPWGLSIAAVDVPGNGDGRTWTTLSATVKGASGVHALWLRFSGQEERTGPPARDDADTLPDLDWFVFER